MDDNFNINLFSRKNELFYCLFEFNKEVDQVLIIKLLILLDNHYPNYQVHDNFGLDEEPLNWKDWVLKNDLKFDKDRLMTFHLSPPFYIQRNDEIKIDFIKNGVTFSLAWNRYKDCFDLIFDLYADVVTDKVYLVRKDKYIEKDQSIAAKKNRLILSDCLKAIEKFLKAKIIEFYSPYHLEPDSVYKYGIKEDACHITDHMDF